LRPIPDQARDDDQENEGAREGINALCARLRTTLKGITENNRAQGALSQREAWRQRENTK
jgi:hypothetical protein